jgi:hypothetical protein
MEIRRSTGFLAALDMPPESDNGGSGGHIRALPAPFRSASLAASGGARRGTIAALAGAITHVDPLPERSDLIVKMSKKMEKRLGKGAKAVRDAVGDSVERVTDEARSHPGRSAAAALGVALVGAAGITAAYRFLRRPNGAATLHVVPDGEDGWMIRDGGSSATVSSFGTKREALRAARAAAAAAAPSQLIIHRADGSVSREHRYEPNE